MTIMDTFEISNEEINVEEIMRKIRENIRKRKEEGTYPPEIDTKSKKLISDQKQEMQVARKEIFDELLNLNINCDIQNNSYVISSHRPILGKALIKGRELVHGEVRRYVYPMILKQINFNQDATKVINDMAHRLLNVENEIGYFESKEVEFTEPKSLRKQLIETDLKILHTEKQTSEKLLQLKKETDEQLLELEDRLEALKKQINEEITVNRKLFEMADQARNEMNILLSRLKNEIREENEERMRSVILSISDDLEKKAWLAKMLTDKNAYMFSKNEKVVQPPHQDMGINYFVFEDKFRGKREDIAQRQTAFLHYFEGCRNVLDIGCGRGEFLEIMRKKGIGAMGVDLDETMVDYCRSKGLDVELGDAFDYLQKIEDSSLDGIFIDQVVEHLEPAYLVKLLKLCFQKMKYGFYLIAETVNPLSFFSFANFYIDLTHIKPVHPETMKFLMESAGFREIETIFSSVVPEKMRLQKIEIQEGVNDYERYQLEIYNRNIEMLNATLYGAQDYAIIGKK
jgi:O-antigen chain-terminating methyltransferase